MAADPRHALIGEWRHSREEDAPGRQVHRPAAFDFPPSRGREGYEFRKDGTGALLRLSPRDGTARRAFTWKLQPGPPAELVLQLEGGEHRTLRLVSVDPERLVLG